MRRDQVNTVSGRSNEAGKTVRVTTVSSGDRTVSQVEHLNVGWCSWKPPVRRASGWRVKHSGRETVTALSCPQPTVDVKNFEPTLPKGDDVKVAVATATTKAVWFHRARVLVVNRYH
jgi:hypothetical protein